MKKIRISHFTSSVCALILSLIFLLGAPMLVEAVKSDPTKSVGADVPILLYFLSYLGVGVLLCFAFSEGKYHILTEDGICVCFLGFTYRKIKWENVFDVTIGPDPLQKYTTQTLLLNCQREKKYRPQNCIGSSLYEKAFYTDLRHGKIICLRCGKKLDSVLMLLNECISEDVMQQMRRF